MIEEEILEEQEDKDLEVQVGSWFKEERQKMITTTKSGYKFDKAIFQIGLLLIFVYLYLAAASMDFNWYYLTCNPTTVPEKNMMEEIPAGHCLNPAYKPATWINEKYLTAGEYGKAPNFFYFSAFYFVPLMGIICLGVNHLIYNKKGKSGGK